MNGATAAMGSRRRRGRHAGARRRSDHRNAVLWAAAFVAYAVALAVVGVLLLRDTGLI